MTTPLADPVAEGRRIVEASADLGLVVRVVGGAGIALRCPSAASPPLRRSYADVDLIARSRDRNGLENLLEGLGYEPDTAFNALHGARRLFFWDGANDRQLDVFLDDIEMCHKLQMSERLHVDDITLSLADLLLMKLQIFETNEKDMLDIITIFTDHDLSEDDSGINVSYIEALTSSDWGLWKTVTIVTERTSGFLTSLTELPQRSVSNARMMSFLQRLEKSKKSRRWKLRDRVGERLQWYELPEEVR